MVILLSVAVCLIEGETAGVVIAYERSIGSHIVLPCLAANRSEGIAYFKAVVFRVFRDDVYCATHGIGSEEG